MPCRPESWGRIDERSGEREGLTAQGTSQAADLPVDGVKAFSAATSELLPFRYLGIGFLLAWEWCLHDVRSLYIADEPLTYWADVSSGMALASALTLIICGVLYARIGRLSARRGAVWAAFACCLAGTCAMLVRANGLLPSSLDWLVGAVLGFAYGMYILLWAEVYAGLSRNRVFLFGSLSCVLAYVLITVMRYLTAPLTIICVVVIALAVHVLWVLSVRHLEAQKTGEGAGQALLSAGPVQVKFPWKPVVVMACCGLAAGLTNFALFGQGSLGHVRALGFVGMAVFLAVVLGRRRMKPMVLAAVSFAVISVFLAVLALAGTSGAGVASLLSMVGYVGISFYVLCLLANICHQLGASPVQLFGLAVGARELMAHAESLLAYPFPQVRELFGPESNMLVIAIIGAFFLASLIFMWVSEQTSYSGWAVEVLDVGAPSVPDATPEEQLAQRLEAIAGECELTEREAEIMGYLVRGDTYQDICSRLVLSQNTIKTHVRHLYAKVGVANRSQLCALVGGPQE